MKYWYMIPYTYGIGTRAKGLFYKISFLLLTFLPMYSAGFWFDTSLSFIDYTVAFLIAFTGFYCIYENGYITNDVLTTRFEEKPVIRLQKSEVTQIEKMSEIYKALRILYAFLSVIALYFYFDVRIIGYVSCLVILNLVYSFHNYCRGIWNIPTILALEIMKYITVASVFLNGRNYLVFCVSIVLTISLERSITYSLQRRLKLKYNEDLARLIYYVVLTIIGAIVFGVYKEYVLLVMSSYMLLFRAMCYLFSRLYDVSKIRKE